MRTIDLTCRRLDRAQKHRAQESPTTGLIVLHGLAMYARDSARSAASLLRAEQTLPAAVLGRVILEHAALAQWLEVDPEGRGQLCLDQSTTSRSRWLKAVLEVADERQQPWLQQWQEEQRRLPAGAKNAAPEFNRVAALFGKSDAGNELYMTYRNLSSYVHPDDATFTRYPLPGAKGGSVDLA